MNSITLRNTARGINLSMINPYDNNETLSYTARNIDGLLHDAVHAHTNEQGELQNVVVTLQGFTRAHARTIIIAALALTACYGVKFVIG